MENSCGAKRKIVSGKQKIVKTAEVRSTKVGGIQLILH
jgi:hypothetical protein